MTIDGPGGDSPAATTEAISSGILTTITALPKAPGRWVVALDYGAP